MTQTFDAAVFATGETVVTANAWKQLSVTSVPCKRVRISAPTTSCTSGHINAASVLVISKNSGVTPIGPNGCWELQATMTGKNYEHTSDASQVWIYGLTAGDAVEWSAEN